MTAPLNDNPWVTSRDPYERPVRVQGHNHSEPICCWPDCRTFLTREEMAALQERRA